LSVGLFANGKYGAGLNGVDGNVTGLFYGDKGQLAASLIGILTNIVWAGGLSFVTMKVLDKLVGNRSSQEDEVNGLDVPEMGVEGYPAEPGRSSVSPEFAVGHAMAAAAPALAPAK
jgi:Amt family ammonium transporter